jgi:hypothetical protein
MPLIIASVLVQLLCAVHCVRNGRNGLWLTVIIFLSIPGCLAYAVFEILPAYSGRREVRTAKAAALRRIDPDREVRTARDALELADTAANRAALGDALFANHAYAEAAAHYEQAVARAPGGDRSTQVKLARVYLEAGNAAAAAERLEGLPPSGSPSENDRIALLLARAIEDQGQTERALILYAEIGSRLPGGEAQCRRAALLLANGRAAEALPLLEEVERLVKRLGRHERGEHAEMYDWASRTLKEAREGPVS